jgi:hypothetical protein
MFNKIRERELRDKLKPQILGLYKNLLRESQTFSQLLDPVAADLLKRGFRVAFKE